MQDIFRKVAHTIADLTGTVWVFAAALSIIVLWGVTGPVFGFSDTWQLIINTGTTIITFLMVFLIQNTQNRDNAAIHAKLDELIVHGKGTHNEIAIAENFTDEELKELREHFEAVAEQGGTKPGDRLPSSVNGHGTKKSSRRKATTKSSPSRKRSSR